MDVSDVNSYEAIKGCPQKILNLINKYVKVELIKNTIVCGFVHSIDPIQHSIILLEPHNGSFQTTILLGHAILNVTEMDAEENLEPPKRQTFTSTVENLHERKLKLISWFKQNLLPVTESEENILFGNVIILPPYTTSDIVTDNPIVALRIQNIMSKIPDDVSV